MKPLCILEIEENIGLECVRDETQRMPTWWVVSPNGFKLFKVGGDSDLLIGMVSTPDMLDLQGLTRKERMTRHRAG